MFKFAKIVWTIFTFLSSEGIYMLYMIKVVCKNHILMSLPVFQPYQLAKLGPKVHVDF